jgi:serine/threonine protein kinase
VLFGRFEILERFDVEGGGFDALARAGEREVRLWVGRSGSGAVPGAEAVDAFRKKVATIYHASLPQVLGSEVVEDRAVLVLQPYRGERLSRVLTEGPLDPPVAIDVIRAAGAALVKAHRAAVVHGAITADEIFRSEDGRTLLLHVGWGAFLAPRAPRAPDDVETPGGTESGDVSALARLLVACLEGRDPIPGGAEALAATRHAPAREAADFPAHLPEGLRRLLARALHPDPARRMRRAEELAGDLGVLRATWSSLKMPAPRPVIPFPLCFSWCVWFCFCSVSPSWPSSFSGPAAGKIRVDAPDRAAGSSASAGA